MDCIRDVSIQLFLQGGGRGRTIARLTDRIGVR